MRKKYNLVNETKKEMLNDLYESKAFKIAKYGVIALVGIYGLGFVFKIFAFTNTNFKLLKNSFKQ
tara:strand:+ start:387 stop:581 length:195 start_codon:yes stop_codon:yes gene_type:complete